MACPSETRRLLIRPYTCGDAGAAFAIYRDPEVARFIGGKTEESVESTRSTLERIAERYAELGEGYGFWALEEKASGEVVGTVILKPLPGHPEVEIGWHLARAAWGQGFATEAAAACLEYGFATLGLRRIVAVIDPKNERSLAVARRLGMQCEGGIRAYDQDLECFSLER